MIFGGQGFPEPNLKLGKGAIANRIKTYNKREVYNDLFQLDCDTLQWESIYPDGLLSPMGRRGHSSIFISSPLGTISSTNINSNLTEADLQSQNTDENSLSFWGSQSQLSSRWVTFHRPSSLFNFPIVINSRINTYDTNQHQH